MPINLGDAFIKFHADTTGIGEAASVEQAVTKASEDLAKAAGKGTEQLEALGKSSKKVAEGAGQAGTALKSTRQGVEESGKAAGQAQITWESLAKTLGVKTTAEIKGTITALEKLRQEMVKNNAPAADLQRTMERLAQEQRNLAAVSVAAPGGIRGILGGQINTVGAGIASAAAGFGAFAAGQAVVTGLVGAIKSAKDASLQFESAWADVTTILDEAQYSYDGLKEKILGLSTNLGDATSLVDAFYEAISSGIDADEAVQFVETVAEFSKAARTDIPTSLRLVSSTMHAYQMEVKDAKEITDIFFATINYGVVRGQELANSMGAIMPVAAALKVPLRDVSGLLAALTLGGLDCSESVTALRQAMVSFIAPTPQAKELAHELGVELSAATVSSKGFFNSLVELAVASKGNSEAMDTFFGNVRALTGVLSLVEGQAENYKRIMEELSDPLRTANLAHEAFLKQISTTGYQLERTGIIWERFWQKVTKDTGPVVDVLKQANDQLEIFSNTLADTLSSGGGMADFTTKLISNEIVKNFALTKEDIEKAVPYLKKNAVSPTQDAKDKIEQNISTGKYLDELDAKLSKEAAIRLKWKQEADKAREAIGVDPAHQKELQAALARIEAAKNKELAALREVEADKIKKHNDQIKRDIEAAEKKREMALLDAGLIEAKSIQTLKQQEAMLRDEYQQKIDYGETEDIPVLITLYEAWKKKKIELDTALRESGQATLAYEMYVTDQMKATLAERAKTVEDRYKEIASKNPNYGKQLEYTGTETSTDVYAPKTMEQKKSLISLADAFKYLRVASADEMKATADEAEVAFGKIEDAWAQGWISSKELNYAEVSMLEAKMAAYEAMGEKIPEAIKKAYGGARKEQEKFNKENLKTIDTVKTIGNIFKDELVEGMATGLSAWITGTGTFAESMKSMLQQMTQLCLFWSMYELAEAIRCLFTPGLQVEAAGHFKSAALYAAAGTIAGLGSRAVPSSSSKETEGSSGASEYQRKSATPVTDNMVYGTNSLNDAYANNLGQKASIIENSRVSNYSNYMVFNVKANDVKSFQDMLRASPKPIIEVVSKDFLNNGEIRRLTMMRSPS